ncbi:MAG: AAA family ATPase [Actinomycetales bacterium]|nr:AAA family ATPase [Actinomycetales bacterium]
MDGRPRGEQAATDGVEGKSVTHTRTTHEPQPRPTSPTKEPGETLHTELAGEQLVVDGVYERLDALRAHSRARLAQTRRARTGGNMQNRSERDSFATMYEDRLAQLESVEDRLVFGRLDLVDGQRRYVGRIGLTDAEHNPLLTDWRAPAAEPFYRATAARPDGVTRRRHLVTRGRRVTSLEDDVLDLDALEERDDLTQLAGEGALLASLAAGRTGKMHDIVATIQAEQDVIVRSELTGALVVQGGPGTGKTAVALHRAAYLLYAHRATLERSGVLVVGPSDDFLRYIDQVLPSLGETGVLATTIADLVPGVRARGEESPEVAEIKGRAAWARIIERAVRQRQRVPAAPQEISIDGRTITVRPADVRAAISRARRSHRPHNQARVTFVREMLSRLAAQYAEQLAFPVPPDERGDIIEDLRTTREVRIALNLAWLPLTPQGLVEDLYAKPYRLEAAAPELSVHERALLVRPQGSPWTPADVPLLDEAAELLGEDDQAERARAQQDAERHAQDVEYARSVLERSAAAPFVSAEQLAERFASRGPSLTTAERAAADRSWTYGHVIVDEAQELSPMDWRTVLRRVPTRSLTIVGDLAQTAARGATATWAERLDPVLSTTWRLAELTVSYRTPATITQAAMRVARRAGLAPSPLTSARDVPDALVLTRSDDPLATAHQHVTAALESLADAEGGRVAVVVPETWLDRARSALADLARRDPHSGEPVLSVLTARQSKGLEFDVVVLCEPAEILAESPGNLYVAMTRPTTQLRVAHAEELPAGFTDGDF